MYRLTNSANFNLQFSLSALTMQTHVSFQQYCNYVSLSHY